MAYELVEKKRRFGSDYKISITKGRTFILNAPATRDVVDDDTHTEIYVDKDGDPKVVKVAFRFGKRTGKNSYVVTHHKSASSVSAKAALDLAGYKSTEHVVCDAEIASRVIGGKKRKVLEIEIPKDLLSQK